MDDKLIEIGKVQYQYSQNGNKIIKYLIEVTHKGLNLSKVVSASNQGDLEIKLNDIVYFWDKTWEATKLTENALGAISEIDNLLLNISVFDLEQSKRTDFFTEPEPLKPILSEKKPQPVKPEKDFIEFTFIQKTFFKHFVKRRLKENDEFYQEMIYLWEKRKQKVEEENIQIEAENQQKLEKYESKRKDWENRKNDFYLEKEKFNEKTELIKEGYASQDPLQVNEYFNFILVNSQYPDNFPKVFEFEYNPETKILIIEHLLPTIESFPKVKEVKYIASKDELKETYISDTQLLKMYDDALYKIALRTICQIFMTDINNIVDAVSENGWVNVINKATGKEENNCVLSIQVSKKDFLDINLENVDPKMCFKNLKGVCGSKLSALAPIQPILQISKSDKRFVTSYGVADDLDSRTNLAAMNWEDFEHLIRELFEKEFQSNGGEVKITQASKDGGVDAVAFDPDPIRGGKIVIQAKRYTNTVGVSAVRDLYGTTMNEGATKGILVTTADYGPDAYDFAKGKPLTLLNGSNLLFLLQKHGYHAKIDLKEAKKILNKNT